MQITSEALWAGIGMQSKLETENTENGAKLASYRQFCFLIFTECGSMGIVLITAMQVMQVCCDVAVDVAVRENAARAVDLGNVVCMSDVSGSMSGTPMEVLFWV